MLLELRSFRESMTVKMTEKPRVCFITKATFDYLNNDFMNDWYKLNSLGGQIIPTSYKFVILLTAEEPTLKSSNWMKQLLHFV